MASVGVTVGPGAVAVTVAPGAVSVTVAVGPGTAAATHPFLLDSGGTDMRLSNDRFDYHALRATVNLRF